MTINYKKLSLFISFCFSLYFVKEANFLFYNSTDSPDFDKYSVYFEYLFNNISSTGREQGLFYYYIQSWFFYMNYSNFENLSFFTLLHKSIQEVNFILFLIGLAGFYKLLRFFKFDYYSTVSTLIVINFLPLSIAQRIVFKPEILTFAFLPWIIFSLEKFKKEKKFIYLFYALPLLVLSSASKGSIFVMMGIFLAIFYTKELLSLNLKNIGILVFVFLIFFGSLTNEDINSNGKNLIEVESGASTNLEYDFKAPVNIIYKIHIYELVSSPIKNNHADSFIAISLLDTFGDYYDIYWDNDSSLYYKNRREVLLFEESNEIKAPKYNSSNKSLTIYLQNLTDTYYRKFFGMVLSLSFYFLLFREIKKKNNKEIRKFLIAPLIGMSVLLIHIITGFPVNNFNPNLGDTLKPLYYAHFFLLAAAFLIVKIFQSSLRNKILIFPYLFIALLIIGFPKNVDSEMVRDITQVNSYSNTCTLNNAILSIFDYTEDNKCIKAGVTRQNEYDFMIYENYNIKPRFKIINTFIGLSAVFSLFALIFDKKSLRFLRFRKVK